MTPEQAKAKNAEYHRQRYQARKEEFKVASARQKMAARDRLPFVPTQQHPELLSLLKAVRLLQIPREQFLDTCEDLNITPESLYTSRKDEGRDFYKYTAAQVFQAAEALGVTSPIIDEYRAFLVKHEETKLINANPELYHDLCQRLADYRKSQAESDNGETPQLDTAPD